MRLILQHLQSMRVVAVTVVIATAAVVSFASHSTAAPATTLASKQAAARQLDEQVQRLEGQYDELQERFRGAEIELESVQADVLRARQGVAGTRKNLGRANVRLRDRAITIYQTGGSSAQLVDLAVSGSFSSLFDRIDAVRRVGNQDATVVDEVEDLNRRMVAKQRRLTAALAKQAKVVSRAKRDKNRMQSLLDQRQAKLDSVNSDIRQIMEAQRAAAERAAAERARESAALANTGEAPGAGGGSNGGSSSGGGSSNGGGISIPLPPGSGTAAAAASAAMTKLGSPYVWAASGPNSFDCSGLVVWAFAQVGRSGMPHSTYSLINMGVEVPMDQLQVGDLVFPSSIGHVGIYVGNGSFVHAPRTGDVVKVTSLGDYPLQRARRL